VFLSWLAGAHPIITAGVVVVLVILAVLIMWRLFRFFRQVVRRISGTAEGPAAASSS